MPRNPNTLYAGNGLISGGVFQTTDGGENWTAVDSGLRFNPVMALAIDPRNGTLLGAYPGPGTRYPYRSRRSAR